MMKYNYKSCFKKNRKLLYIILVLCFIMIFFYLYTERNIRPKIVAISEIRAKLIATQAINEAINEKVSKGIFENLINVKTDNNGKVTLVQANTVEMNRLAVETSITVQKVLEEMKSRRIKIPIGDIFGSQIFANYGPCFNISIMPAGSVASEFNTEFIEAGINQTRLKIYLTVNTSLQIVIPFANEKTDVTISVPVSETIIVGDVPESYISIPRKEDSDFLRIVPD